MAAPDKMTSSGFRQAETAGQRLSNTDGAATCGFYPPPKTQTHIKTLSG